MGMGKCQQWEMWLLERNLAVSGIRRHHPRENQSISTHERNVSMWKSPLCKDLKSLTQENWASDMEFSQNDECQCGGRLAWIHWPTGWKWQCSIQLVQSTEERSVEVVATVNGTSTESVSACVRTRRGLCWERIFLSVGSQCGSGGGIGRSFSLDSTLDWTEAVKFCRVVKNRFCCTREVSLMAEFFKTDEFNFIV